MATVVYSSGNVRAYGTKSGGVSVDGYSGYQIGNASTSRVYAYISFTLPNSYKSYENVYFRGVFYAPLRPTSWYADWGSIFAVQRNGSVLGGKALICGPGDFSNYSNGRCEFSISLNDLESFGISVPTFLPGDKIDFIFDSTVGQIPSDYTPYIASGQYLNLCYGSITADAVPSDKKYLVVKGYTATSVYSNTSGTYYVTLSDYKKYWERFVWDAYDYMPVTLDGNGGGYYSDVTYYLPSNKYLTDNNGNRLYIP